MIDTITLSLNIRDPEKPVYFDPKRAHEWIPNISHIIAGKRSLLFGRGCLPHHRPPLPDEKQSGLYFPEVKLLEHVKRGSGTQQELYITFSAPKLVFGNNFNELSNKHLCLICICLAVQLKKMGIYVSPNVLRKANVSEIHYSKNILLKDCSSDKVFAILRRMSKPTRKNWRYERYSSYYGNGQSVYIYTKKHSLCLYDKKAESRKHKTYFNPTYIDAYELPNNIDVLRIEARCGTPADIKTTLGLLGFTPPSLTLENLFDVNIAKTVLLHELKELHTYIPPIVLTGSLSDILSSIATLIPTLKTNQLEHAATIIKLQNELGNENAVKKALGISSAATWSRRKSLVKSLKLSTSKTPNFLSKIERQLTDFVPIVVVRKSPP